MMTLTRIQATIGPFFNFSYHNLFQILPSRSIECEEDLAQLDGIIVDDDDAISKVVNAESQSSTEVQSSTEDNQANPKKKKKLVEVPAIVEATKDNIPDHLKVLAKETVNKKHKSVSDAFSDFKMASLAFEKSKFGKMEVKEERKLAFEEKKWKEMEEARKEDNKKDLIVLAITNKISPAEFKEYYNACS